jgi:hypothetical protein
MKIVKNVRPPAGSRRLVLRAPVYVYRLGLGWLFGNRLMLLNHLGRASGRRHQTILEVADHAPTDGSFVVASGWGPPPPGTATSYAHQMSESKSVRERSMRRQFRYPRMPAPISSPLRIPTSHGSQTRPPARAGLFGRRVGGRLPGGGPTYAVRPVRPPDLSVRSTSERAESAGRC